MKKIRRLKRIQMIPVTGLILILSLTSCVSGQDRNSQTDEIIRILELVEDQRTEIIEFRLRPLIDQLSGSDSIELRKIERQLSDEEIHRRISSVFEENFTDQEINDIYNFLKTSAFEKFFKSGQIYPAISEKFEDINDEITKLFNSKNRFKPIPVDRMSGFYATIGNTMSSDYSDIKLENEPALTPKDVKLILKESSNFGFERHEIKLLLTEEGSQKFYQLTKANSGRPIAIVIENQIVALPTVQSVITSGQVSISGNYSENEIDRMIEILKKER
jgi:hypothetical protein